MLTLLLLACAPDPNTLDPESAAEAEMALAMLPPLRSWFLDSDRDGYGQPGTAILSRTQPRGHVDTGMDCDDDDPFTYPGAAYFEVGLACETDTDGDGFGAMEPASGVNPGLDCDDEDAMVSCVREIRRGNGVELDDPSNHLRNYLLGSAIHVPTGGMTLTALALIGMEAVANVKMALYTDSSGEPDELVVATSSTPVPVGVLEIPVAPTRLPAGTYWIMAVYDVDASIGSAFAREDYYAVVQYRALDFSDPIPSTFGDPVTYTGRMFNYYMLGY